MSVLVIEQAQIVETTKLDAPLIRKMRDAFVEMARLKGTSTPMVQFFAPEVGGQVCVKGAILPGEPYFAVKASANFPENSRRGLPTNDGFMVVFDARTGAIRALLLDAGYLTRLRTAAAGAAATQALARADATRVTVLGAGNQGRLQIQALAKVRKIGPVTVWARQEARARALAHELSAKGIAAAPSADLEAAVRGCEILITTTSASSPFFDGSWVQRGTHVTAVGSDAAGKNEIPAELIMAVDCYACDDIDQCSAIGEFRPIIERGLGGSVKPVAIGDIISGRHPGRIDDGSITVADLTGVGLQDMVIASHALASLGGFSQDVWR